MHRNRNPFDFLVASLCPAIVGNDLVKAGMLQSEERDSVVWYREAA